MRYTYWLSVVAALAIVAGLFAQAQSKSSRLLVLNKDDQNMAVVDPESGSVLGRGSVGQGSSPKISMKMNCAQKFVNTKLVEGS